MDEHPDRTLRAAHHLADLARGHLLHEPEHEGTTSIAGQSLDDPPGPRGLVVRDDGGGGSSAARTSSARSKGRLGMAPVASSFVGQDIAADLEQPYPEGAARVHAPVIESGQATQRLEEHLLGDVLGGVMGARLVEGEAVHLGHVLPVEGVESQRVPTGGFHRQTVGIDAAMGAGTLLPLSPS